MPRKKPQKSISPKMSSHNAWVGEWSTRSNNALATLHAYKRQVSADVATRARIIRDSQRTAPYVSFHVEQLIRAPLAGIK